MLDESPAKCDLYEFTMPLVLLLSLLQILVTFQRYRLKIQSNN